MNTPGTIARPPRRLAAALLVLTAACGVPVEDQARATPVEQLPYGIAQPPATTERSPSSGDDRSLVYLVQRDRLTPVARAAPTPLEPAGVLRELTSPLSEADAAQGLRTALSDPELIVSARSAGNVAVVELSADFTRLTSRDQLLALGQIVLTVTGIGTIERVRFEAEGEPLAVPRADGSITSASVEQADYLALT